MPNVQKSLRISRETVAELEGIAKASGKDFTAVANEILEEGIKTRHCPGIVFSEGTAGKRARIAGTGIEVWELVAAYRGVGKDLKRLGRAFHWLSAPQFKSALAYYSLYAKEIDGLIAQNEGWNARKLSKEYPVLDAGLA